MDVLTGAIGNLAPELLQLLQDEYNLPEEVKKKVKYISHEIEGIKAALEWLGKHPRDQLDPQYGIWARRVRESLYDMEDVADIFLVRVEGGDESGNQGRLKRTLEKMGQLFSKSKARHNIASIIRDITKQVEEAKVIRDKYQVVVAMPAAAPKFHPRLSALYKNASELVGIEEPRDKLIEMLLFVGNKDGISSKELQKVWVVGSGGLGKTTLAKAAYDKVKSKFDCCAFVQVGQTPVAKKVLTEILTGLIKDERGRNSIDHGKEIFTGADLDLMRLEVDLMGLEADDLIIRHIREFLQRKRYLIVVDDIWQTSIWETIKHAFDDSNPGSRIVMTGRNSKISADIGGEVYRIQKLSNDNSRKLFDARVFEKEFEGDKSPEIDQISAQILQRCDGVPLAIIAVASVLANKQLNEWPVVYKSIGFEHGRNQKVDNMMKILSLSYYDLPSHLKTCLMYLSLFPEDYHVNKNSLIWMWIAEGLVVVPGKENKELFQVGESYLYELINRGLILPVENGAKLLVGCRVHDFVLDWIRKLAREENFVVVPDSEKPSVSLPEDPKVRRLALQNIVHTKNSWSVNDGDIRCRMAVARSLNAINTNLVPPVDGCNLLRVLALENCWVVEGYLKHVGKQLPHLRYLGLTSTRIKKLPANLGNLKFLQALMLQGTGIEELPESLGQLTQLMCLRCDETTRVPDWIGNLTSLVELEMYPGAAGKCFVKELGKLTNLRVLKTKICLQDEGEAIDLLWSLSKLKEIETMEVGNSFKSFVLTEGAMRQQQPGLIFGSRNLRVLDLSALEFTRMPEWINVEAFPNLCLLILDSTEVGWDDMKNLARFQQLQALILLSTKELSGHVDLDDVEFQNLVAFFGLGVPMTPKSFFQIQRAMPRLEDIAVLVIVVFAKLNNKQDFGILGTGFSSLQRVRAFLFCYGSFPAEVEEVEAAIRHQVGIHTNHPTLEVLKYGNEEAVMANTTPGLLFRLGLRLDLEWERLKEKVEVIGEMAQAAADNDVADNYIHAAIHHKVRGFRYHCFDTFERAVHGRILWRNQLADEDHQEDGRLLVQRFQKSFDQYQESLMLIPRDRNHEIDWHNWRSNLDTQVTKDKITENIAVLEQMFERFAVEIPKLDAMWEELKAEISQQATSGAETDKVPSIVPDETGKEDEPFQLFD